MYLSQNMVALVNFGFHSQRRPKILNICVSEKMVDYVDLGFASKARYVHVSRSG